MPGLFDEILKENNILNKLASNSASKVTILDPGVTRAFCETCREIINLVKVDSWTCNCGNTWQLAPQF